MVFDFICAVSMVKISRVLIIMLFCLIVFFLTEKSIPPEIRDQLSRDAPGREPSSPCRSDSEETISDHEIRRAGCLDIPSQSRKLLWSLQRGAEG